jgi:hypothetical protein
MLYTPKELVALGICALLVSGIAWAFFEGLKLAAGAA